MTFEIDFNALQAIAALQRPNKPNLLEQVVWLFESESPKYLEQISSGVDAKDLESIRVGAHSLKSSSANVGAVSLSQLCRAIEHAARTEDLDEAIRLSADVASEFDASAQAIRSYLDQAA